MSRSFRLALAALGLGLATSPLPAFAFAIFTVGPGCPYATIQAALTASYYSPGEDYVWISNDYGNHTYAGEHITIANQDVDIEGGFSNCNDFDIGPNDYTTISGAGNDGGPVFEISGNSHVYLGNLVITGAQRGSNTRGGGISFIGEGALTIGNTTVSFNHASTGGGIYISAQSAAVTLTEAKLTLLANTLILSNTAVDGAGIALSSAAPTPNETFETELYAWSDSTFIAYNTASRRGGGIFIGDDAVAYIGSPGYGTLGVVFDNSANQGGGVAVYVDRVPKLSYPSAIDLFSVDASRPVRIQNNSAVQSGGGVYVSQVAIGSSGAHPSACFAARDFRIDENVAPEGAAIHAERASGTVNAYSYGLNRVQLNGNGCGVPSAGIATASCAGGVICNSIDNNIDEDGQANHTAGATVLFETDGELNANRVSLRNNIGGNAIHAIGLGQVEGKIAISNALIADNSTSNDLLKFAGSGYFDGNGMSAAIYLTGATITHNSTGSPNVIYAEHNLYVEGSIIDQPGVTSVSYVGPASGFTISQSVTSDMSVPNYGVVQGAPAFVNSGAGDYHLIPWSLGVDFVYSGNSGGSDLDGNARVWDLSSIPDFYSGFGKDAGAYEVQFVCAADEVFCSGFE